MTPCRNDEKSEKLLSLYSKALSASSNTYSFLTDTDIKYGTIKDEIGNDVEVTTLNPSQIAKLCDGIIDTAGDIVEFESKWQKTDKAQETVLRKLDEVIRDAIQDDKDSDNENSKEREIRTLASAATNFIKRVGGIQAQVASFALPVYAATLNWCEGSMRNYKK